MKTWKHTPLNHRLKRTEFGTLQQPLQRLERVKTQLITVGLRPCPCRMGDLWKGAKWQSNCPVRRLAGKGCCHRVRGAKANLLYGRRCTRDITPCLVPHGDQIMQKHKCSQAWNHKQVTDISNIHPTRIGNSRILSLPSSTYPGKEIFFLFSKGKKNMSQICKICSN